MKRTLLTLGVLLGLHCATSQAQLVITTNTVAPVVGPYDQYYLPGPVDEASGAMTPNGQNNTTSAANDALTYVASDRTSKGQTFTTGSNPAGYTISSVTVRHLLCTNFLSNGTWMGVPNGAAFAFRFGTLSGTTLTPILTTNATYSGNSLAMSGGSGTGIYLTFDLSGAGLGTLSPNTTYFFELASSSPYIELHNTRTNATYHYAGGTAFAGDTAGALDQSLTVNLPVYGGEFAFDAALAAVGAPAVTAVATPASGIGGQTFTVAATVTPGSGTVTNVSINLSPIGGPSAARLVLSNANVYTNTFAIPASATLGATNLVVTVTDNTPLAGNYALAFTVLPSVSVWSGASSADSKWTTSANWLGNAAPSAGSTVFFAGATRLTPDMNASYTVSSLTFSNTVGSFVIGSSTGGTLTDNGGIVNNSANTETLNVPVVLGAAQAINAAAGNLVLNSNVTGGAALTIPGAGTVTLAGSGASALGDLLVTNGLLKVAGGTVLVSATQGNSKIDLGGSVEVDAGASLMITNGGNAWFPLGDTSGTTNTLTVAGGAVVIQDNWGIEAPRQGNAIININSGSFTVNDSGGIGLILGDQGSAQSGELNLNGGTLIVNRITANNGTSTFYFNGGTLQPTGAYAAFFPSSSPLTAYVRNGGAIVNSAGFNVTIAQYLGHSPVSGDNATDGGLTKTGNGSLTLSGGYGYTGPNQVLGGTLILSTSQSLPSPGGDLVVSNATLTLDASSGTSLPAANVVVKSGATLNLTNNASSPAINGTGNLTLSGGTTINLNYGALSANPTAAAITVAGTFATSGLNAFNITGSGFVAGDFPLISYTGTTVPTNAFKLASLPAGVNAVLTNNAANNSLDLLVTLAGNNLGWHGASPDGTVVLTNWDINTSSNWYDANMNSMVYRQYAGNTYGDLVTFGDNGYNTDGTNHVNLAIRVKPSAVTFGGTMPYTLTGSGGIDGATAVVMNDPNSVYLGTSNNYTGGTYLNAGTLIITNDSALGTNTALLTLAGGTLQVGANSTNSRPVAFTTNSTVDVLAGASAQWSGLITGDGGLTKTDEGSLILAGASTNALGNLLVNGGLLQLAAETLTVYATNGTSKIDNGGGVAVAAGSTLYVTNGLNAWFPLGDTAGTTNTLTIDGGTVVIQNNWGMEAPRQGSAILTINSGSLTVNDIGGIGLILGDTSSAETGLLNLNGGTLTVNRITSNNGTNILCFNGGTLEPTGAYTTFLPASATLLACVRNGGAVVDTAGYTVSIAQSLAHSPLAGDNATDGGLVKTGTGTLNLNGANSYTGPTVINGGTLGGTGIVAGNLTNNATLAPGGGGIGTLTVNGNLTLKAGSTNLFRVNGSAPTNDVVVAGGNVTCGGVLSISPSGTFASGQQFVLFSGAGATSTGNFASLVGSPGDGLAFSFTNGVLSVVATGPTVPEHLTNSYSAGVLSLSWPAGKGWRLQMQTNNLASGLGTNWVYLTEGSVSSTNISVNTTNPTAFYRLTYP